MRDVIQVVKIVVDGVALNGQVTRKPSVAIVQSWHDFVDPKDK